MPSLLRHHNTCASLKPQAKLCLLEVEKLDACIRPLFANPVIYIYIATITIFVHL